jgi:hypothetical protein
VAENWTDYLLEVGPDLVRRQVPSQKLIAGLLGTPADVVADALVEAANPFISSVNPADSLPAWGRSRGLERYPYESDEQFRSRLQLAWVQWQSAATPAGIVEQLAHAGYPGAMIQRSFSDSAGDPIHGVDPFPGTASYWSGFVTVVPIRGYYDTLDTLHYYDELPEVYYDGDPPTFYDGGSELVSHRTLSLFSKIINKWKAADWKCHAIVLLPPLTANSYDMTPFYKTNSESLWTNAGVEMHNVRNVR